MPTATSALHSPEPVDSHAAVTAAIDAMDLDVAQFVMCISVVDEICGPLANRLSGREDAHRMLRRLTEDGILKVTRSTDRTWYAFAPPTQAALDRIRGDYLDDIEIAEVRRHAARWFLDHEDFARAAIQTIHAGDRANGLELLALATEQAMVGDVPEALRSLTLTGPDTAFAANPWISFVIAVSHTIKDPWSTEAEYYAGRVREAILDRDTSLGLLSMLDMIRAAYDGNTPKTHEAAEHVRGLSDARGVRREALNAAVHPYLDLDPWNCRTSNHEHALPTWVSSDSYLNLVDRIHQVFMRSTQGGEQVPLAELSSLASEVHRRGWSDRFPMAVLQTAIAKAQILAACMDEAQAALDTVVGRSYTGLLIEFEIHLIGAELALATNDVASARTHAGAARAVWTKFNAPPASALARLVGHEARIALAEGRLGVAERLLSSSLVRSFPFLRLHQARLAILAGHETDALTIVEPIFTLDPSRRMSLDASIGARLVTGEVRFLRGHQASAARALTDALDEARGSDIVLPFVEAEWTDRILRDRFAADPTYADQVAEILAATTRRLIRRDDASTTSVMLSAAERDVLVYLSGHAPLRSIAQQRGVSVNTVKTQVSTIYRKLGVSNRADAAQYAARHGIAVPSSAVKPASRSHYPA